MMPSPFRLSREVYVPQLENGLLHYTIMEIIAASDEDSGWAVKDLPVQPFPVVTGPPSMSFPSIGGVDAPRVPKAGFQSHVHATGWGGNNSHME